jgi:putative GTP pyrophosphokinase
MIDLERAYRERFDAVLTPLAVAIEDQLREYFQGQLRIDRITARPKSVDRFLAKAQKEENGRCKYSEPLSQIQDQVGARIVTFYLSDVRPAAEIIKKYYRLVEFRNVIPESEWEFGYFGQHFVSLLPSELVGNFEDKAQVPQFFELQVKTLFQHAWSEANHDLGFKPGSAPLSPDEKRRLAFTSAQAWGADRIFDELFRERNGLRQSA